jgi:hypothetical protein
MKLNRSVVIAFILLIVVAALYRAWDGRPFGFAPHLAMAIFGGAIIKNKKLALVLPILSLFLSDLFYQGLFLFGYTPIQGFYSGQWVIYLLIVALTVFGFAMRKINIKNIIGFSLSGSMIFFLLSNFAVWIAGAGLMRPKTLEGLMMCYNDGLAFYRDYGFIPGFGASFILSDLFFMTLLFGSYYLIGKTFTKKELEIA